MPVLPKKPQLKSRLSKKAQQNATALTSQPKMTIDEVVQHLSEIRFAILSQLERIDELERQILSGDLTPEAIAAGPTDIPF